MQDYSQEETKATVNEVLQFLFEGHFGLGKGALLSPNKYVKSAAYAGLCSVVKQTPAASGRPFSGHCVHSRSSTCSSPASVVAYISRLLASSLPLQKLSKNQMEIYRTPSTEVWTFKSEEYVPQVVTSQNVKKLKGMPGAFSLAIVATTHWTSFTQLLQVRRCTIRLTKHGKPR